MDWVTTYPFPGLWEAAQGIAGHPATRGPIVVGSDVWIGYRATILSGTRVGNGAVIGAGSVVTGEIPAYAIAAGNPCRVIRHRFAPDVIERLEEVAWWNWPDEDIVVALPLLQHAEVRAV